MSMIDSLLPALLYLTSVVFTALGMVGIMAAFRYLDIWFDRAKLIIPSMILIGLGSGIYYIVLPSFFE